MISRMLCRFPVMPALAILCLFAVRAPAQPFAVPNTSGRGSEPLVHERWTTADGLPVNAITHLLQSRDGYLWVATFDGLARFDGERFTVYNSANSALPSDRIVYLTQGRNGDLWMLTEQRMLVRMRQGRFTTFQPGFPGFPNPIPFVVTPSGTVFMGTTHGVSAVRGDSLVVVARELVSDTVLSMVWGRDGTLLLGTARSGVKRLRVPDDGPAMALPVPGGAPLDGHRLVNVHESPDGELFALSLNRAWRGRTTWREIPLGIPKDNAVVFISARAHPNLRSTLIYHTGLFRVTGDTIQRLKHMGVSLPNLAWWDDGVELWHTDGNVIYRGGVRIGALGEREAVEFAPTDITVGLFDREGSLWIGTRSAGLHRLKPAMVRSVSVPEGLHARNVYGTAVDRRGMVWSGSLTEGFSRFDPSTGRIDRFGQGDGFPNSARSFLEDRRGALWIGSGDYGKQVVLTCQHVDGLQCIAPVTDVPFTQALALFEDTAGEVWVGTDVGPFRWRDGRLVQETGAKALTKAPVRAFAETPDGAIWMGTDGGGLLRYARGQYSHLTIRDGLPSDAIRSLHAASDGILWIGTEGRGLGRIDTRTFAFPDTPATGGAVTAAGRRIVQIGMREGLFDRVIHQILEDDAQRLWMSTNRGIFWISRAEANAVAEGRASRVHFTAYTDRDGMNNREGNGGFSPSGARSPDGRLWFPTQDGLAVIDPRSVRSSGNAVPVLIEQVGVGDSILPVGPRPALALSADQRDLRIEYTALTLLEPKNVRFRYRMDGYDETWVDAGERRSAFYTKLPAGRYVFRVQASMAGDDFSPGATLSLSVQPRFHERGVVQFGSLLLASGLVLVGVRSRVRSAHRRAMELEQLVSERTVTLKDREVQLAEQNQQLATQAEQLRQLDTARSRFFANVSHELRTPLTLTIGPLENLRQRQTADPEARQWLDLALRNSTRLLTLVNQLLDVAKLEAGAARLAPAPLEVTSVLRALVESFEPAAARKALQLFIEMPAAFHTVLDQDALEKTVSNLLSNAVKFTPPGGHVHLTLSTPPGLLVITVRNSGPPIPPEQLAHVFERFYQVDESQTTTQAGTGIGLSLVKELVELQQGIVRVTSDITGTAFVVTLPAPTEQAAAVTREDEGVQTDGPSATNGVGALHALNTTDATEQDTPTLLVVDDSDDLRAFVRGHFAAEFRVLEAANGEDGLALARSHLPDVILSDVMMPGMDGRSMVRALRSDPETDFLAVVLLTAQAEDAQRLSGLELGADDYLVKPFSMRELDLRVRNMLAARRRLRHRFADGASRLNPTTEASALSDADMAPPLTTPRSADEQAYLDRLHKAVQEHLGDQDFGVGELAHAVFQDRTHLFRRVRELLGVTPSELLRRARLDEAARLLTQEQGTVADVAFTVGFRSVSHFCRSFQEQHGVSPTVYRSRTAQGR